MASQMFNYAHSDHSTSAYSGEHGEVFEGSAIGSNFDNTFDNKIYGVDTTDMINDDGLAYQLDQFTMDSQFSHMMPVMPEMDLLPTPSALLDSYGDDSYGYGESNVLGQVFGGDLIGDIAAFVTPLHAEPWTGTRADWMTSNHSLSVPSQAKFGLLETTYPGSLDGYNPDSGYDSFQTADTASQFSAPPGFMIPQDDDEREQNCDIEQDLTPRQDHVAVQDDASEQSHTSENGHGSEQEHSDTVERPNKRAKKSSRKSSHKVSHKGFHCLEPGPHRTRDFANIHDLERHRRSTHGIRSTTSPCLYFRCMVEGCPSGDKEWDRKDNFRSHLKRRHFNDMPDEESTMEANAFLAQCQIDLTDEEILRRHLIKEEAKKLSRQNRSRKLADRATKKSHGNLRVVASASSYTASRRSISSEPTTPQVTVQEVGPQLSFLGFDQTPRPSLPNYLAVPRRTSGGAGKGGRLSRPRSATTPTSAPAPMSRPAMRVEATQ